MDWTLEVVVLPVSDLARSIAFYRDQVGFALDHDTENEHMHVAQLTPRGSGCSIVIGTLPAQNEMAPGSMRGLQLVVSDAAAARQELLDRGVEASEIKVFDERDGGTFFGFADPDGNTWAVQQLKVRAEKPLIPSDARGRFGEDVDALGHPDQDPAGVALGDPDRDVLPQADREVVSGGAAGHREEERAPRRPALPVDQPSAVEGADRDPVAAGVTHLEPCALADVARPATGDALPLVRRRADVVEGGHQHPPLEDDPARRRRPAPASAGPRTASGGPAAGGRSRASTAPAARSEAHDRT